jgi:Mn2+/Fe2+ NRAMP family transporter
MFVVYTFLFPPPYCAVGYGDIIPTNHLSRILTVIAAIAGVTVTALLVAVMSSKLTLSKGEARVVHLLNKDRLRRELYENAAKVMQAAIKFRRETKGKPIRRHGPARVRLFRVLRNWRNFKRGLSVSVPGGQVFFSFFIYLFLSFLLALTCKKWLFLNNSTHTGT